MKPLHCTSVVLVIFIYCLFSSCNRNAYQNIPYFADLPDSSRAIVSKKDYKDLLIRVDDILNISIQTIDPLSASVNSLTPGVQSATFPASSSLSGVLNNNNSSLQTAANSFIVDKDGLIELPTIGKIHVEGLSTNAARDTIHNRAAFYFKEPTVNVRFANFKINVLGEVMRPGTYVLPSERATIFDALGMAGDLTVFGKRENIVLVRDSANINKLVRLNLNSKNIVASEYFYLRQNDVIYVEPNKAKIANLDAVKTRNFAIASSVLSVLIIIATRIK
jgi:polysaccharide export outer membrane protein